MITNQDKLTVVMAVHNEEKYLPKSLSCLKNEDVSLIVILDQCTDNSEKIIKDIFPEAILINKIEKKWENSYAENLQLGYEISNGDYLGIFDADICCQSNSFIRLRKELVPPVASISAYLITDKTASFMNNLYYYWEKTFDFGLKEREPRGAVRVISREALLKIGGFKDVPTPDTQLDLDLRKAGYESKLSRDVICIHLRVFSFKKSIETQIVSGRMRRKMKMPFIQVVGHSIIRLRPFVLYGYLIA
ncbi:MAG: glycosyltransferase [Candidatus Bathyarchaeia archaeon]